MDKKEKDSKDTARIFYVVGFVWLILGITNFASITFFIIGITFIIIAHTSYYPISKIKDLFAKDDEDDDNSKPPAPPNATAPTTTAAPHKAPKVLPPPRPLPPTVADKEV